MRKIISGFQHRSHEHGHGWPLAMVAILVAATVFTGVMMGGPLAIGATVLVSGFWIGAWVQGLWLEGDDYTPRRR